MMVYRHNLHYCLIEDVKVIFFSRQIVLSPRRAHLRVTQTVRRFASMRRDWPVLDGIQHETSADANLFGAVQHFMNGWD